IRPTPTSACKTCSITRASASSLGAPCEQAGGRGARSSSSECLRASSHGHDALVARPSRHTGARFLCVLPPPAPSSPARAGRGPRPGAWVRQIARHARRAHDARERPFRDSQRESVHVAFTYAGLRALGLKHEELLAFSREFVHGMNHGLRAKVLGDTPSKWTF